MDDIFNFAQQQMDNYSARFGNVNPMQQDVTWSCSAICSGLCRGMCGDSCGSRCSHGCSNSCKHACDAFGGVGATQRRSW